MDVTLSPRGRAAVAWIAAALGVVLLFEAGHALAPFAWAVITAYILHPLVGAIHRRTHLPKQLITGWLYILIGLVLIIIFINLTPPLLQQLQDLQQQTIPRVISDIDQWFNERKLRDDRLAGLDTDFIEARLNALGQQLADLLGTEALPLLLSTFSFAIELLVYLIASFYLIVYGDRFMMTIRDLLNRRYHREFD